ncbi:unnamed protein product, partial [Lymnaea stagnalis]
MTSMAGSDVIIGTFVMPLSISEMAGNGEWQLGPVTCALRVVMDIVCCTLSIYHVVAMAVDRYLAVCRPWVYRSLTPRTAYVIILVCWMIPLLLVSVPILAGVHHAASDHVMRCALMKGVCVHSFSSTFLLLSFSVSFYIPITATLALYFVIARKIFRRGAAVVRSCSNRIQPGTPSEATSCATPVLTVDTLKSARTIGLVVICFVVSWLPFSVITPLGYFRSASFSSWSMRLVSWMGYMNSAWNPLLF